MKKQTVKVVAALPADEYKLRFEGTLAASEFAGRVAAQRFLRRIVAVGGPLQGIAIMSSTTRNRATTVLVVDDDPLVRMDLAGLLVDHGLEVLEAESADEAVKFLHSHREIEFLVTDIEMPGSMDGLRLAHHVRHRWPPIKILVISGRLSIRREDLPDTAVFIRKPFANQQILTELTRSAA